MTKILRTLALVALCALMTAMISCGDSGTGPEDGDRHEYRILRKHLETVLPCFVNIMFQVTDMYGAGIPDMQTEDFTVKEDNVAISPTESAMQIRKRDQVPYTMRVVLLLDNSFSVGANLEQIKAAAVGLVNQKPDSTTIAVVVFSENPVEIIDFSDSKADLIEAIDSITLGAPTTDLYGSIVYGVGKWSDHYGLSSIEQGNMIVLTDGSDTQGSHTLEEALSQRGSKRVYAVGLGDEIEPDILRQLGNAGFYSLSDISGLANKFLEILQDMDNLANSFYWLNYMSPKRGYGEHELLLSIKDNRNTGDDRMLSGAFRSDLFSTVASGVFIGTTPVFENNPFGRQNFVFTGTDEITLYATSYLGLVDSEYAWSVSDPEVFSVTADPVNTAKAVIRRLDGCGGTDCFATLTVSDTNNAIPDGAARIKSIAYAKRIPAGAFEMGSPGSESQRNGDETQHPVLLARDIFMSSTEITQADYQDLMGENPSASLDDPALPVERVRWLEAIAYCNARSERDGLTPAYEDEFFGVTWNRSADGWRLPTEAEWEYACRAGTTTPFSFGYCLDADTMANYDGSRPYTNCTGGMDRNATTPAGHFAANAWGLYDMHGNVFEWCWDMYQYNYDGNEQILIDPTGGVGDYRVVRGGDFNSRAEFCRSARRGSYWPETQGNNLGFRVVRWADTFEGEGVIVIETLPDDLDAPWILSKSGGFSLSGRGAITMPKLPVGDYTLVWSEIPGRVLPDPATVSLALTDGDTLTFSGDYAVEDVLIEGGVFLMGSPVDEVQRNDTYEYQHTVTLTRDFRMQTTEVTQVDYLALMGVNPSSSLNSTNCPVERVSFFKAIEYCNALSLRDGLTPAYTQSGMDWIWDQAADGWRLPTEAEWEYACRAGTTTPFNTGECIDSDSEANLYGLNRYSDCPTGGRNYSTLPVAGYPPNAWGLYDMHGNIFEWCWDWFQQDYYADDQVDPTGGVGTGRVVRGGSWNYSVHQSRSAYRNAYNPASTTYTHIGFRPVRTVF